MNKTSHVLTACIVAVVAVQLWAISRPAAELASAAPPQLEGDPRTERVSDEGELGEAAYLRYCAGCHGVTGDGLGPAAPFLNPKPRDFTKGVFKFGSRPSGNPPTDEDLLRTITHGLPGTSMPAWRFLPLREREAIVRYLKTFLPHDEFYELAGLALWETNVAEGEQPIAIQPNPFDRNDEDSMNDALSKGSAIYHKMAACLACHPSYLDAAGLEALGEKPRRPNLHDSIAKPDTWGQVVMPPDFRTDQLKSVRSQEDLYRVIAAGVGGTAMPSWTALNAEQIWALTLYVDSLLPKKAKGGAK